ncbi:hypothetical protein KJ612_14890, partial [Myxococcota bacterium]|nr:hypothetical protein [Myxococcota bacterium]
MMKNLTVGILISSMVFLLGTGCDDDVAKTTVDQCTIGDVTVANGELNPENGCEKCDVLLDAAAWSPNDGATCDDG